MTALHDFSANEPKHRDSRQGLAQARTLLVVRVSKSSGTERQQHFLPIYRSFSIYSPNLNAGSFSIGSYRPHLCIRIRILFFQTFKISSQLVYKLTELFSGLIKRDIRIFLIVRKALVVEIPKCHSVF